MSGGYAFWRPALDEVSCAFWDVELKNQLFSVYPKEKARKTIQRFAEEGINEVSTAIEISTQGIARVLKELTRP